MVQVFKREFYTSIHLNYARVEVLFCIKKKEKPYFELLKIKMCDFFLLFYFLLRNCKIGFLFNKISHTNFSQLLI